MQIITIIIIIIIIIIIVINIFIIVVVVIVVGCYDYQERVKGWSLMFHNRSRYYS